MRPTLVQIAAVFGALCALLFAYSPLGERTELLTQDWRLQLKGKRPTRHRAVVFAIDDATIQRYPEPISNWGGRFAKAFQNARTLGLKRSLFLRPWRR